MNALIVRQADPFERLAAALREALAVAHDPALERLRQACELRIASSVARIAPLWQRESERIEAERSELFRVFGGRGRDQGMKITSEGEVDFEVTVEVGGDEASTLVVRLRRLFPEQPPEVHLVSGEDRVILPLDLQRVWSPDKTCAFAVQAAVELLKERAANGRRSSR